MAKMTRQELIEILKQNDTYDKMVEAVRAKELTEEEMNRIFDFLATATLLEADYRLTKLNISTSQLIK